MLYDDFLHFRAVIWGFNCTIICKVLNQCDILCLKFKNFTQHHMDDVWMFAINQLKINMLFFQHTLTDIS